MTIAAETLPNNELDPRKIRFASIEGIERSDLPLANEIWLQDVMSAPWSTREAMKLAQHMVRYMGDAKRTSVGLTEIETLCQLGPEETRKTLGLLRTFGAIDSFQTTRTEIAAQLHLSLLQRLRVLETRTKLETLSGHAGKRTSVFAVPGQRAA
jgi:hypothetical protein